VLFAVQVRNTNRFGRPGLRDPPASHRDFACIPAPEHTLIGMICARSPARSETNRQPGSIPGCPERPAGQITRCTPLVVMKFFPDLQTKIRYVRPRRRRSYENSVALRGRVRTCPVEGYAMPGPANTASSASGTRAPALAKVSKSVNATRIPPPTTTDTARSLHASNKQFAITVLAENSPPPAGVDRVSVVRPNENRSQIS